MQKAIEKGDVEKYVSFFSEKKKYLHLGSGKNEHYYGREGMREGMTLLGKIEIRELAPPQIYIAGNFAWSISKTVMSAEDDELDIEREYRVTMLFEKEEEGWKIVHVHSSTPESGIEEGQMFATISGFENQIAKWINTFDLDPHFSSKSDATKFKSYLLQAQEILQNLQEE